MEWFSHNWFWVVGGTIFFLFIVFGKKSNNKKNISSVTDEEKAKELLVMIVNVLEKKIHDIIGMTYGREDRYKIACGMIAIMVAEKITLADLQNPATFAAVAIKSHHYLLQRGDLSGG